MAKSEISIPTPLTLPMEKELLELYLDGMELDLLSSHLNLRKREIVRKLSELFFNIEQPEQNSEAPNCGKPWNWGESSRLWKMHAVGTRVQAIAEKLGRDELGVCYRLLSENLVIVPSSIVEKYELDDDNFATDAGSEQSVKTCSNCLDVVAYCTCQWKNKLPRR